MTARAHGTLVVQSASTFKLQPSGGDSSGSFGSFVTRSLKMSRQPSRSQRRSVTDDRLSSLADSGRYFWCNDRRDAAGLTPEFKKDCGWIKGKSVSRTMVHPQKRQVICLALRVSCYPRLGRPIGKCRACSRQLYVVMEDRQQHIQIPSLSRPKGNGCIFQT